MAEDEERLKRRIRKKLIQIEHLEILPRQLNEEERFKVGRKPELREQLRNLIAGTDIDGRGRPNSRTISNI